MTRAQYDALMEIAENGERFAARDLNISARTVASIAKRGWIAMQGETPVVTEKGWQAVAAA